MKKKQRLKYMAAIYTVITMFSAIMWMLAYFKYNGIIQATLLNLSTELLGVVLIFFIVNYLFTMDEWDTSERIGKLLDKLENEKKANSNDFFIKKPSNDEFIEKFQTVDLCGVTLASTIDVNLDMFRDSIRNGSNLRILVMELNDDTLKAASNRSEQDDKQYYKKKLESTILNINYLNNNSHSASSDFKGTIQVGFLPYPPSFGIKIFKNNEDGVCIVEQFSHHVDWGNPPIFLLDYNNDSEWFNYFQNQFDAMWDYSKKYNFSKE